jgi:hypothetical protein
MLQQVPTLVGLLLEISLIGVALFVLIVLLRYRRSCEAELRIAVLSELALWEPEERSAVRAYCSLVGGPPTVTIDLGHCSARAWWNAISGLYLLLPSYAKLALRGTIEQRRRATFVIEAARVDRPVRVGRL